MVGQPFALPLEVTVTDINGSPVSNDVVSFSSKDEYVTLSSSNATTGVNGKTQVTATAGPFQTVSRGGYTVTAFVVDGGGATFSLTQTAATQFLLTTTAAPLAGGSISPNPAGSRVRTRVEPRCN